MSAIAARLLATNSPDLFSTRTSRASWPATDSSSGKVQSVQRDPLGFGDADSSGDSDAQRPGTGFLLTPCGPWHTIPLHSRARTGASLVERWLEAVSALAEDASLLAPPNFFCRFIFGGHRPGHILKSSDSYLRRRRRWQDNQFGKLSP